MRLLITAAGTGTAFSYATAVAKNFPSIELVTADTNSAEYVTASLFSVKHYQVHENTSPKFIDELLAIVENERISHYIPLIDTEAVAAHDHPALATRLRANNLAFCRACIQKDLYPSSFDVGTLLFPRILDADEAQSAERVVAKQNGGFGGRRTKILSLRDPTSPVDLSGYVLYEHVEGDEYTVDCFPIGDFTHCSIRRRAEIKNGVCTKAHISRIPELEGIAARISRRYELTHPYCFQVIGDRRGFHLIDVNPRLGAGSAMSGANGMDFFSAHIASLLGEDALPHLERIHDNGIVTRQYANYLMKAW